MTVEQLKALKAICDGILETVQLAGPLGAPGGHLYAALMAHGVSLEQFEQLMGGLVAGKLLRKQGDCYFVTARAESALKSLKVLDRNPQVG